MIYVTPHNNIMSTFEYYFRQAGITTLGPTDPVQNIGDLTTIFTAEASAYLSDRVSSGEEIEVVANPTSNWTLRAAFSAASKNRPTATGHTMPISGRVTRSRPVGSRVWPSVAAGVTRPPT